MDRVNPSNRGDNSPNRVEVEVVDMVAPALLISPRPPGVLNRINDNYCVKEPSSLFQDKNQVNSRTLVNCHVVTPAHCVIGQSQKKDASPSLSQKVMKCVKGAPCVSYCLSVPVVPNALNVVKIYLWEAVCKSFGRSGSPGVQIQG